eukprot:4975332-Pleurochrysis_carterae.AAC.1
MKYRTVNLLLDLSDIELHNAVKLNSGTIEAFKLDVDGAYADKGDAAMGDAAKGDAATGDAVTGDAAMGDATVETRLGRTYS